MNIVATNKISFGFRPTYKLNPNPKNGQEANEYFLAIDEQTRKIPADCWDDLYSLSEEEKLKLADFMKATYIGTPYYLKKELLNPKEMSPTIDKLVRTNGILEEEEIATLKSKLEGTFDSEKLTRFTRLEKDKDEEFLGNLWFLKNLMTDEPEIFETMHPITVNKIFMNSLLNYDDFSNTLSEIKDEDLLTPPSDLAYQRVWDKKEWKRMVLHESLLGESYYKNIK